MYMIVQISHLLISNFLLDLLSLSTLLLFAALFLYGFAMQVEAKFTRNSWEGRLPFITQYLC